MQALKPLWYCRTWDQLGTLLHRTLFLSIGIKFSTEYLPLNSKKLISLISFAYGSSGATFVSSGASFVTAKRDSNGSCFRKCVSFFHVYHRLIHWRDTKDISVVYCWLHIAQDILELSFLWYFGYLPYRKEHTESRLVHKVDHTAQKLNIPTTQIQCKFYELYHWTLKN